MSENESISPKDFQRRLYQDLDNKLRSTAWNSGASEAHGLLTGLACRGIKAPLVRNKMYLFQVSDPEEITLLEGLFELILRDPESDEFTFNLLLPDDQRKTFLKTEELSNWCGGFLQGFCHDSETVINNCSESVQEFLNDLFNIGGINLEPTNSSNEENEKSLIEIEEYLRVGIQLVYDELVVSSRSDNHTQNTEIH